MCEILKVSVNPRPYLNQGGEGRLCLQKILTPPDFQTFLQSCHLMTEQEKARMHLTDKDTGLGLELEESMSFLKWLANNYKNFGSTFEIITYWLQEIF